MATDLKNPSPQGAVPIGGIIMWSGTVATIPPNWQLCNGTNGTHDLRDKFVICAKQDDGGVPKTNVTGALTSTGGATSHGHTVTLLGGESIAAGIDFDNVGTTDPASHLPPYYALAFIQRLR